LYRALKEISPLATLLLVLLLLLFDARTALCLGSCTISATPIGFGNYNVFSGVDTVSTGTVTFNCTSLLSGITIDLDRGGSPSFLNRIMKNGSHNLNYNLYLDAAHSVIWGDATGGSQHYINNAPPLLTNVNITVFGRIPALQDSAIGMYSNTVIVTINF
jgi:spore coat protein U-like protein